MDFKKILVTISGNRTDEKTIQLACNLAKKNKAKVYGAYIIQIDRTLPLDAEVKPAVDKAESALRAAESYAETCDHEITTDLLQARAIGPALVDEALERQVDLLIMGMEYETRFGEFTLGDTVPYVLKNAPCHVMIWRDNAPQIAGS